MRLFITFSIAFLIITYSITSYADKSLTKQAMHKSAYSDLLYSSSPASQLIFIQDLNPESFNTHQPLEITPKLEGKFTTQFLSIEAGILQSKQEYSSSKYYLQGAVTLHQYDELNVSIMANIEQLNNLNYPYKQAPFLSNSSVVNETELNYSYGIITSYSISPAWQLSGGIIHARSLNPSIQKNWYGDANMALIGTTYSF